MNDLSRMTNQPIEVSIGGKTLKLCAPTLQQEAEHELWLQKRYAEIAGIATASPGDRMRIMAEAASIEFYSGFAQQTWWSLDGGRRLIAMCAQKHQPGLKADDIEVTPDARPEYGKVIEQLRDLLFPPKDQPPAPDAKPAL